MFRIVELSLVIMSFLVIGKNIDNKQTSTVEPITQLETNTVSFNEKNKKKELKSFDAFLKKLAWRESRGDWKTINQYGYMGKYQIGKKALVDIGMDSINVEEFREDSSKFPEYLQDIAIKKYIKKNRIYLKKCITNYKNKTIKDIYITESSIIAAAHLVGHSNVQYWLECNGNISKVDGNGTNVESYLKMFSGYKIR